MDTSKMDMTALGGEYTWIRGIIKPKKEEDVDAKQIKEALDYINDVFNIKLEKTPETVEDFVFDVMADVFSTGKNEDDPETERIKKYQFAAWDTEETIFVDWNADMLWQAPEMIIDVLGESGLVEMMDIWSVSSIEDDIDGTPWVISREIFDINGEPKKRTYNVNLKCEEFVTKMEGEDE